MECPLKFLHVQSKYIFLFSEQNNGENVCRRRERYCAVCKRKHNEVTEDGTKITLNRIPGGQSTEETARRKAW